jgi:hypothetical protein
MIENKKARDRVELFEERANVPQNPIEEEPELEEKR